MSKIHESLTELVGHTPLVRLHGYEKLHGLKAHLLAKVESKTALHFTLLKMQSAKEKSFREKPL